MMYRYKLDIYLKVNVIKPKQFALLKRSIRFSLQNKNEKSFLPIPFNTSAHSIFLIYLDGYRNIFLSTIVFFFFEQKLISFQTNFTM